MFFVNMNNINHTCEEIERLLYKRQDNQTINKNRLKEYFLLLDDANEHKAPENPNLIYKDYIVYV